MIKAQQISPFIGQVRARVKPETEKPVSRLFAGLQLSNERSENIEVIDGLCVRSFDRAENFRTVQFSFEGFITDDSSEHRYVGAKIVVVWSVDQSEKDMGELLTRHFFEVANAEGFDFDTDFDEVYKFLTNCQDKNELVIRKGEHFVRGEDELLNRLLRDTKRRRLESLSNFQTSPYVNRTTVDHHKKCWDGISADAERLKSIDVGVRYLVNLLNRHPDIATRYSCSGHPENNEAIREGNVQMVCGSETGVEFLNQCVVNAAKKKMTKPDNNNEGFLTQDLMAITVEQKMKTGPILDEQDISRSSWHSNWFLKWSAGSIEQRDRQIKILEEVVEELLPYPRGQSPIVQHIEVSGQTDTELQESAKPIEEAPRDGTWFYGIFQHRGRKAIYWVHFANPNDRTPVDGSGTGVDATHFKFTLVREESRWLRSS